MYLYLFNKFYCKDNDNNISDKVNCKATKCNQYLDLQLILHRWYVHEFLIIDIRVQNRYLSVLSGFTYGFGFNIVLVFIVAFFGT